MRRVALLGTFAAMAFAAKAAPLIDHHQHLFGPASGKPVITAKDLIALLDLAGIRRAAVLSIAYQYGNPNRPAVEQEYEKVKAENDWTSQQVSQFPDRLVGFCGVNPLKEYAIQEMERCAKDPRLRTGLKLHFGNSDVNLENAQHVQQLQRVFRKANDQGMAIVVHMRSTISQRRPYGATQARIFLNQLLPAAPNITVQIAHLAGAGGYDDPAVDQALGIFIEAIAAKDPRMARVYFDASGVAGLGNWTDKVSIIASRIRQLGIARVLYGSDGAGQGNATPLEAWTAFRKLPLSEAEFQSIANNVAPYMK